ncbi:MAG: DUF2285 domain-containing protein [Sphingobium sp.]
MALWYSIPPPRRVGGCTFPEDPGLDCTQAAPLWRADIDPCVLLVFMQASAPPHGIDFRKFDARILRSDGVEHVRLVIEDEIFRLDVVDGMLAKSPLQLEYLLKRDWRLQKQIETIRRLERCLVGNKQARIGTAGWISRRLAALQARDARIAGASLRDIAIQMWGPGDWPGPGECRKSAARRLVAIGERLICDGPWPILAR